MNLRFLSSLFSLFVMVSVQAVAQSPILGDNQKQSADFEYEKHNLISAQTYIPHTSTQLSNLPEFDNTVITETPAGTLRQYTRSGYGYMTIYGIQLLYSQAGTLIDIVFDPDGKTVYLKDVVSQLKANTWTKGTIEGDKIHVPLYQMLTYYDDLGYGLCLSKADIYDNEDGSYSWATDTEATEMTFTLGINGTISLDGTDCGEHLHGESLLAVAFSTDLSWTGYGDYESRYVPMDDIPNELPDDLETEPYVFQSYYSDGYTISVGVKDNKMYVTGISMYLPKVPIIGEISQGKVTFPSDQFLGFASGYAQYFCAGIYDEQAQTIRVSPELVFDYDADARTLTSQPNDVLIYNSCRSDEGISYFEIYRNPNLSPLHYVAAIPVTPEVHSYGYVIPGLFNFEGRVRNLGTNGEYLDPLRMEWAIYLDDELYTFSADDYALPADRTWFGYYFMDQEGGYDIYYNGYQGVYLSGLDFTTIAIQGRYNFEGESYYTDIAGVNIETDEEYVIEVEHPSIEGLDYTSADSRIHHATFDLQGRSTTRQQGLLIRDGRILFCR